MTSIEIAIATVKWGGGLHHAARETVQRTITWLVEHGFVSDLRRQMMLKTASA
jgi:hypothetical protein